MTDEKPVWALLQDYAATQTGSFTSQEAISWFRRHAPNKAADSTIRVQMRGACTNVANREQFSAREPFLTRIGHGVFRRATEAEIESWREDREALLAPTRTPRERISAEGDASVEWHTEANTQRMLVEHLEANGWTITRTANTESGEHGIDVIAERDQEILAIEVKGYPSLWHVRGPLKGQRKASSPNNQASKWFAHAIVPAMRVRSAEPLWRSAICFPDQPIYRRLYGGTATSLGVCGIEMWLVSENGSVEVLD